MLLESAIFLHPSMAAYLVGEMATATHHELSKLSPKKLVKRAEDGDDDDSLTLDYDENATETPTLSGQIDGDADSFDPFACDDDNPCPTTPFEYSCIGGRCSPIMPKVSVSNPSVKEAMLADWNCYIAPIHKGGTLYCGGDWPNQRYPSNSYGGRGSEKNRVEVGQASQVIPESKMGDVSALSYGGGLQSLRWFAQPRKSVIPLNIDWVGVSKGGYSYGYSYSWVYGGKGEHQHDAQYITPTGKTKPSNVVGIAPIKKDYKWDSWLTHEWRDECKVSNAREVACCTNDCRCYFRCKYRAYFTPNPNDPRFVADEKGQRKGALYGTNAQAQGVQPQTLLIEIEGQDTTGCWSFSDMNCSTDSSFSPAAGDEYSIKVYRYTSGNNSDNLVVNTTVTSDGLGKAIFAYTLPKEGLYQVVIDHKISGNGCIPQGPNLTTYVKNASPYHVNFGFFVSPPPVKYGCTDSEASNYDSIAVKDDGSCYSNDGLFDWFGDLFGGSDDGTLDNRSNVDSTGKSGISAGLLVVSAATIGAIMLFSGGNGGA